MVHSLKVTLLLISSTQRSIIVDFLNSLSSPETTLSPSVSKWWQTTTKYRGGSISVIVGKQTLDENYSLGKSLKTSQLTALALTAGYGHGNAVNVVLTSADVAVCMSRCRTHVTAPQTPPLVAPNGDVGVEGMVINLATVLAGTVINPFNNGYFEGALEAVSACTAIFGEGAYA
ncbi:hypothetical protein GQ457_03G033460 [Hibiscus cannabinus]